MQEEAVVPGKGEGSTAMFELGLKNQKAVRQTDGQQPVNGT